MTFFYSIKDTKSDYEGSSLDGSEDSIGTLIASSPRSEASFDRSSINSIPWADEAIKQNQYEWEKIENTFYGEEELPKDEKIREEFLEWMTAFPHLRILGKSMHFHYDPRVQKYDESYEEIFAIDPPIKPELIPRRQEVQYKVGSNLNNQPSLRLEDRYFGKSLTHRNNRQREEINLNILSRELTKYLKITPSPILNRRSVTGDKVNYQHDSNLSIPYLLKIPNTSNTNSMQLVEFKNADSVKSGQDPYSDSQIRMPQILNIKMLDERSNEHQQTQNFNDMKSAVSIGQLRSRIVLPAIDVKNLDDRTSLTYRSINNGETSSSSRGTEAALIAQRSISAVNKNKTDNRNKNYSKSASKVKIFKFN